MACLHAGNNYAIRDTGFSPMKIFAGSLSKGEVGIFPYSLYDWQTHFRFHKKTFKFRIQNLSAGVKRNTTAYKPNFESLNF
jgi:hypothetical protein